jgi:hypothetical protein
MWVVMVSSPFLRMRSDVHNLIETLIFIKRVPLQVAAELRSKPVRAGAAK